MKQSRDNVSLEELDETTQGEPVRVWRERVLTPEDLFHAEDEAGRIGWFLRLSLTGLYPRRIGPYSSKEEALAVLNAVTAEFILDTLTTLQNDLEINQACVQEGIPALAPTAPACV